MKKAEAAILILLMTLTIIMIPAQGRIDYFPGDTWRTSTPEAQGMDSGYLALMLDCIRLNDMDIHSIVIIRHGYVVLEVYKEPFGKDVIHNIQSSTKSFTSAMVGIALREGYITNIDQRVVDLYKDRDIKNLDDKKMQITIKNLLTMSSGIEFNNIIGNFIDKVSGIGRLDTILS